MTRPFYIPRQKDYIQGKPIIDEQHRGSINSLHYFIQQQCSLDELMPTIKLLLSYLVFHYKTEQGILRASEYPGISGYNEQMNR